MKYLKIVAVAVVAMFAFEGAKAQVAISAQIGTPVPPARTVIVERPVERRVVVVNRHHRYRHYRRPHYSRTVVVARPVHHRRVIVRHY